MLDLSLCSGGRFAEEMAESDIASRAKARSWAEWKRSSRFFSRQRCTMRCIPGGVLGASCATDCGSSFNIAVMVSADVGLRNVCLPVTIS